MAALLLVFAWGFAVLTALVVVSRSMGGSAVSQTASQGLDSWPHYSAAPGLAESGRRVVAVLLLAFVFWLTIFVPLATYGETPPVDPQELTYSSLFSVHGLLMFGMAVWAMLAFIGYGVPMRVLLRQWGLYPRRLEDELRTGLVAGVCVWFLALAGAVLFSLLAVGLGYEKTLAKDPSPLIVWMAGLPIALRVLISLSAGICEELFFRGFLQPRLGITVSTVLFVGGHLAYEQPWMLLGVTLLSLYFAFLAHWRGNIIAAIVAHTVFDAIQLLVVIPASLDLVSAST